MINPICLHKVQFELLHTSIARCRITNVFISNTGNVSVRYFLYVEKQTKASKKDYLLLVFDK